MPHEGLKTDDLVGAESIAERLVESNVSRGNSRVGDSEDCGDRFILSYDSF
jgi:hypothetical protein